MNSDYISTQMTKDLNEAMATEEMPHMSKGLGQRIQARREAHAKDLAEPQGQSKGHSPVWGWDTSGAPMDGAKLPKDKGIDH